MEEQVEKVLEEVLHEQNQTLEVPKQESSPINSHDETKIPVSEPESLEKVLESALEEQQPATIHEEPSQDSPIISQDAVAPKSELESSNQIEQPTSTQPIFSHVEELKPVPQQETISHQIEEIQNIPPSQQIVMEPPVPPTYEELQVSLQQAQQQHQNCSTTINQQQNEIQTLKEQLLDLQKKTQHLEADVKAKSSAIVKQAEELQQIKSAKDRLQTDFQTQKQSLDNCVQKISEEQKMHRETHKELERAQASADDLKSRLQGKIRDCENLQDTLTNEIKLKQQALTKLSWIMTIGAHTSGALCFVASLRLAWVAAKRGFSVWMTD